MTDIHSRPGNNYASILEAALDYVRMGYEVIPGYSPLMFSRRGNTTWRRRIASSTGKCPLRLRFMFRGLRTEKEVRYWFGRYPQANIYIRTGLPSGIVVLDVDSDRDTGLLPPDLHLPCTRRVATGSGEHYYFLHPGAGVKLPAFTRGIFGTLTLIGDGGRVIAPPSLHASGARYQWVNPEAPIAALPSVLLQEAIRQTKKSSQAGSVLKYYFRSVLLLFPKYFIFFGIRDFWDRVKKVNKNSV